MTSWHPEHIEKLRIHVAEGLTGGQIGTLLGKTRSAIMGMAKRQGLKFGLGRERPKAKRPVKKCVMLPLPQCPSMPYLTPMELPVRTKPKDPVTLGDYTIMQLKDCMCRWPMNDQAPFMFCGANTDSVYCPKHYKLSVQPSRPRDNRPYKEYGRPYSR